MVCSLVVEAETDPVAVSVPVFSCNLSPPISYSYLLQKLLFLCNFYQGILYLSVSHYYEKSIMDFLSNINNF